MTQDELLALAAAIAAANGHPAPAEWAAVVAGHYTPPQPAQSQGSA